MAALAVENVRVVDSARHVTALHEAQAVEFGWATGLCSHRWLLWLGVVAVLLFAAAASGHPLAPALLELREGSDGRIEVRFKTSLYPRSRQAAERLRPRLPESCVPLGAPRFSIEGSGKVERWTVRCASGLVASEVGVRGLAENRIDALLRVELADGRSLQHVLRAGRASLQIPARPQRLAVLGAYLEMGVRHIFLGLDHLLFVLGLVLLVAGGRGYASRLFWTLSAFTLGHCLTLSLAVVGWLRLPGPPVELAIAASVLALAVALARGRSSRPRSAMSWLLAGSFGLLHGLGFAATLLEAGLPEGEILVALASFNLGIEVGQVAFVVVVVTLREGLRVLRCDAWVPRWAARIPVYTMGSLAAMWCIERATALLP